MKKILSVATVLLFATAVLGAQEVMRAIQGTVEKVDSAAKTILVKTADGTEHTLHFVARTAVHGADAAAAGAKDTYHGITAGSEVVAHYTKKGATETAQEIDSVGKDGLKASEGTVSKIDRSGKTLVVKAADGTEQTYHMTDDAAKDAGRDLAKGTEKSAKVTVYYTEDAGRKVAHFFKKTI